LPAGKRSVFRQKHRDMLTPALKFERNAIRVTAMGWPIWFWALEAKFQGPFINPLSLVAFLNAYVGGALSHNIDTSDSVLGHHSENLHRIRNCRGDDSKRVLQAKQAEQRYPISDRLGNLLKSLMPQQEMPQCFPRLPVLIVSAGGLLWFGVSSKRRSGAAS
jgi:hypothetical protein